MRMFSILTCLVVVVFLALPAMAEGVDRMEPELRCEDPQTSRQGDRLEVRCRLELVNDGSQRLTAVLVKLADQDGASVARSSFGPVAVDASSVQEFDNDFKYSFNFRSQEPPDLTWNLRFTDATGSERNREVDW